ARLDAEDFRARDAAFAGLQRLGGPAALVLLRHDAGAGKLTAEQRAKVAAFLADYRPLTDAEAADRRRDPDFLLTCIQYSTDATIRRAAADALAPQDPSGRARAVASLEDAGERFSAAQAIRNVVSPDATFPDPARSTATTSIEPIE